MAALPSSAPVIPCARPRCSSMGAVCCHVMSPSSAHRHSTPAYLFFPALTSLLQPIPAGKRRATLAQPQCLQPLLAAPQRPCTATRAIPTQYSLRNSYRQQNAPSRVVVLCHKAACSQASHGYRLVDRPPISSGNISRCFDVCMTRALTAPGQRPLQQSNYLGGWGGKIHTQSLAVYPRGAGELRHNMFLT